MRVRNHVQFGRMGIASKEKKEIFLLMLLTTLSFAELL